MSRPVVSLKRSEAAVLLEIIAAACAEFGTDTQRLLFIKQKLRQFGIEFEACPSPCHENEAHTDNCWACAPHWGVVGPEVKVR